MGIVFIIFAVLLIVGIPFTMCWEEPVCFILSHMIFLPGPFYSVNFGMNTFVQVAIPLFILAGNIMDKGGSLGRIIHFAKVCVGDSREVWRISIL